MWNMFQVNNKNPSQWRRSGVFIVNFEHISHLLSSFYGWLWASKCQQGDIWFALKYSDFVD